MRKLAVAACAFSAAVFAANYIVPESWLVPAALVCMLAGAALFAVDTKGLRAVKISLFSLCVGLLCFYVHSQNTTVPARELAGEKREITATVVSFPYVSRNYDSCELKLNEEGMPGLGMILYDYNQCAADLRPGQTIRFTAKLKRADVRWGQSYDYYNSKDIYLIAETVSRDITVIESEFRLSALPVYIGKAVSDAVGRIFPGDTAPFMKALMVGDRSDYNADVSLKTAMSYAGFAHIIAVSGMHVAFLVGFLTLILGKSRRSSLLCMAVVWLFVLSTGASPSAVRAGVMQSLVLIAPIVKRENDPITSLSAALAAILFVNPFAASSISLQLSFGAMTGILCLGDRLFNAFLGRAGNKGIRRLLVYPAGVAASSLAVFAFTAPLMAAYFGYQNLLSPITNIFGIWAVSVCFGGGYTACLLSVVPKLGEIAAWIVSWFARYIFLIARTVCAIPYSVAFFENRRLVWWLIVLYVLFGYAFFSKKNRRIKAVTATAVSVLVLFCAMIAPVVDYRSGVGTLAAVNVGQGQCLAVMSEKNTILVDCGATGTQTNAGEAAASYLRSRGREKADALILTHLHKDHANGVETLMELVDIDMLILNREYVDEDGVLPGILASAQRHGTEVIYIDEDMRLECGKIRGELYVPGTAGDANERCLTAKLSIGSYDMIVTADVSSEAEIEMTKKHDLSDAELLIVGHHGSKHSSCEQFLRSIGAKDAIISVGYNTYGHPTDEVLERLAKCGYNVYRTDEQKSVEMRIG